MTQKKFLPPGTGLKFWLTRVAVQRQKADQKITFNNLHDLRTALRRCRTFAKGLSAFGEKAAWRQMDRLAKTLFKSLAGLRDIHVLTVWTHSLFPGKNPVRKQLLCLLGSRERMAEKKARKVLRSFDGKKWQQLSKQLSDSFSDFKLQKNIFREQALHRLDKACRLHQKALQEGTDFSYHRLRIALKRFRYIVENFLPEHHLSWGKRLKQLQDLLGECHDLSLLEGKVKAVSRRDSKREDVGTCLRILQTERSRRIRCYLSLTTGKNSCLKVWDRTLRRSRGN